MTSCPIQDLSDTLTRDDALLPALTDGDHRGLLEVLTEVPDPRDPRGVRYRSASLLGIAVCAVLAGAVTFAAVADWLDDLTDTDLAVFALPGRRPAATTLWRLLVRVDSVALSRVLATWLLSSSPPAVPGMVGVDGKTIRGTATADGTGVHLLSAYDTATGVTLAQIPLQHKGGEIAQVKPLVDQIEAVVGSVRGILFVADALHAHAAHARDLTARGAGLLVQVKANQRRLFTQLRALPWPQVPVGHRTRDTGHGRRETRTLKAVTVTTPGGLGFPHAAQAVQITRTRIIDSHQTRETAYLIVTLPAERAHPANLIDWARLEWMIENRSHYVRDCTLREDEQRATTGNGPAVFAVLRNTAIGYHRTTGETNIARALRRSARHTSDLIHAVTSTKATTQ